MSHTLYFKGIEQLSKNSIIFNYVYDSLQLQRIVTFDNLPSNIQIDLKDPIIHKLITYLSISLSTLFFDIEDFDEIDLGEFKTNQEESLFFENVLQQGLAEFHFVNKLSINHKTHINSSEGVNTQEVKYIETENTSFIMNGGGKDSALAGEIAKEIGLNFDWFVVNPNPTRDEIISISQNLQVRSIRTKKVIPEGIISKYHGHKPTSLTLLFLALTYAYLLKKRYIIAANEYSANFSNISIDGIDINHQYTKSLEFENNFNQLIKNNLFEGIEYFSILRPLYEIQIIKLFSKYSKYFTTFVSCNHGVKEGYWCLKCHKCAFAVIALSAFINEDQIKTIWKENPLQNTTLLPYIVDLINKDFKPFECIGTQEESLIVLSLLDRNGMLESIPQPYKDIFRANVSKFAFQETYREYMLNVNRENNFPHNISPNLFGFFKTNLPLISKYLIDYNSPTGTYTT